MTKPIKLYLDDAQLAALGDYAAYWAYLETELEFKISAMTHVVHQTQAIPFAFKDRMDHWAKLMPKVVKPVKGIIQYAHVRALAIQAHNNRQKFLHGRALGDPLRKTRRMCIDHHQHRHGKWKADGVVIEPRSIRKQARYIGIVISKLIKLNERYLPAEPYTLPNRYPAPPRDGRAQTHQGHIGSLKPQTRFRPSLVSLKTTILS